MTVRVARIPSMAELLRVIKVAHLSHMTSMSRNKLKPAEGDKSLEQERLLSEWYGACLLNELSLPLSRGNSVHE